MAFDRNRRRVVVGLLVFIFIAAAIVSTLTAPEIYPVADAATTSIYALHAGHGDLAVGAYSRFYWHHPGPLLYQVLALPYAASGLREISLKWTGLTLNLIWLSATLALVFRQSPRVAIAVAGAFVPLLWREQGLLFATWNPLAPVLALPLAVVAAADVGTGGRWSIVVLVATLSYCVQAHVGLLVVTVALVVGAGLSAWLLPSTTPSTWWWRLRRPLVVGAGIFVLLWAIPLIHELRTWPGNLVAIARFFLDPSHPHPSWARSVAVACYTLNGPLLPSWEAMADVVTRHVPRWVQWLTGVQCLLLGAAAVTAARRDDRFEAALALVCVISTLAIPVAVHGIAGEIHTYLLVWIEAIGALSLGVLIAAVARWIPAFERASARAGRPLLMAFVVCWALLGGVRLVGKHADQARDTTIRALAVDLQAYCRTHGIERPVLGFDGDAWQQGAGIVLQYYKADASIAVPTRTVYVVGDPFAPIGREDAEFYVMPSNVTTLPANVRGSEWVTTRGAYRIVRLLF
jgi:hypothetical protein